MLAKSKRVKDLNRRDIRAIAKEHRRRGETEAAKDFEQYEAMLDRLAPNDKSATLGEVFKLGD